MTAIRSICVFCGSRVGSDPSFTSVAAHLGTLLAEQGISLVYGGGAVGLMGVVANAALKGGGHVVGVLPGFLKDQEVGMEGLSEIIHVDSMHQRKQCMFDLSDGFLVLPGGLGTLDEAIEILTWKQLRLHDKPLVFINHDGYWAAFQTLVDSIISAEFASPKAREQFAIANSVEAALSMLQAAPRSGVSVTTNRL